MIIEKPRAPEIAAIVACMNTKLRLGEKALDAAEQETSDLYIELHKSMEPTR